MTAIKFFNIFKIQIPHSMRFPNAAFIFLLFFYACPSAFSQQKFTIQGEQNENYGGTHYEMGNPEILFRTPPVQLQSNLYNTENPRELVLGNFEAMAASHYTKRFDN